VQLDRVVVVVNNEAVTQYDVNEQKRVVLSQMRDAKVQPPAADALEKQVLERLVTERAMLQYAKESGIRVDDQMVERTILRIAQENKMTPEEFRKVLEREKVPYAKYREDIRREVTIQRIREREVDSRVSVSDAELDAYLATVAAQAGGEPEPGSPHPGDGPRQASPDQINARKVRAEIASGKSSPARSSRRRGRVLGCARRNQGRRPWVNPGAAARRVREATRHEEGDVSPVLQSRRLPVIQLVDLRNRNAPTVVEQTHARHVLIRVNEITSDTEARAKIDRIRDRIETGAKFEDQAKLNSEDASSSKGGDLGWLGPGDTVPEFEQAMSKLAIGQVSVPVRTTFGWRIIMVEGRRAERYGSRKRDVAHNAIASANR
jgi:peptidyl-prolyl cis-trans isomerase SurA